jgi:chromosome segregation ATPase
MASIKEQIAALKARFDELQARLREEAKSNAELRNKLAKLNESINLLGGRGTSKLADA